ncbi:MAG: hypothetical protein CMJ06_03015 [Pelagibacterales bacterium]|nr:hypothetical protein [Pelagibacterales bacterium]OUU62875.1 MAG: hypothetical protein CBC22_02995 [Alphaproteobacteria bacterium TMED62]|tara:strand:+ start:1207 stop:2085 length:879 start_codon:yes stop_codon:yes gene_type:complete
MLFYSNKIKNIYALFILLVIFLTFKIKAHDCLSMDVAKAIFNNENKEPIQVLNDKITLEEAYCGQEKLNYLINKKYNDKIGYKVGFTGKVLQERFNIETPATGVLYKHMFLENNGTINHKFAFRTFIEPDMLVIIKSSNIMNAKNSLEILENIKTIHPFIEIPSLAFNEDTVINGNMLVAGNMLATKMVMGNGIKVDNTEEFLNGLANIKTTFKNKDGRVMQEAMSSNLMGNPINVLKWLINDFNEKGKILQANDRISLGSVGKLYPLKANESYIYTFDGFGQISSVSINTN